MNNMTLLKGYVSRNFEVKTASNGKKYAVGNLAVATGTVGPDGKKQYNFLPFKAFGKTAELMEAHLIAGDYTEITGQLSMNSNYVDKAGKQQYGTMFIAVREFSRLNQRETVKPQVVEPVEVVEPVVEVAGSTIL
jgi:gp52